MVKKVILITLAILFILLLAFVVFKILTVEEGLLYTEKIDDYNTDEFPIFSAIFLDDLPDNLNIVSFVYYNYWHEAHDVYLEISFDTPEDMERYISSLKQQYCTLFENTPFSASYGLFIEEKNPYDENFTDLFFTVYSSWVMDEGYTGYMIEFDNDGKLELECNFGVISYSYTDLTVIQSATQGTMLENIHDYIPKYFLRFNVPLNEESKRFFYLETDKD